MSVRRAYIYHSILIAFIIAVCVTTLYVYTVPSDWYEYLLFTNLYSIPLIVLILLAIIIIGTLFGMLIGHTIQRQIEHLNSALFRFNHANESIPTDSGQPFEELEQTWKYVKEIEQRFREQTKASQKMANERVEWNEQKKHEAISEERNRLARELHDSVSQQLFAASMLLSAINEQTDLRAEKREKQLKMVQQVINQTQSEMRALLLHLRPIQLEGKSLTEGMEELCTELSTKQPIKLIWQFDDVNIERGIEDHLFRIVQEAISNTLRHAKATTLELRLMNLEKFVFLKMIDDGVGFDVSEQKVGSYGLNSIKERVSEMGGTVKLVSIKNRGTSIEIKVPIIEQKDDES